MEPEKLKLFLFSDDIEEILVVAKDRDDAFNVIEEAWGAESADQLVLSFLFEYLDDFEFGQLPNGSKLTAERITTGPSGRGIVRHSTDLNKRIKRPEKQERS